LIVWSCSQWHIHLKVVRDTDEAAAVSQVTSAVVICRSRPTKDEITVIEPVKNGDIAEAIVTMNTNSNSCIVDLKHAGRPAFSY
jgi:hypothetical protein